MLVSAIQGAADGETATVEDVCINHSSFNILMTQQFLYRSDIVTILQQVRRKTIHIPSNVVHYHTTILPSVDAYQIRSQ